jgi:hypothetical protein
MFDIQVRYIKQKRWYDRTKWELLRDYHSTTGIVVPAGFVTDGASVPVLFRSFISPTGKIFPAAIIHDFLLKKGVSPEEANAAFEMELFYCGISTVRLQLIINSVKFWFWVKKALRKTDDD